MNYTVKLLENSLKEYWWHTEWKLNCIYTQMFLHTICKITKLNLFKIGICHVSTLGVYENSISIYGLNLEFILVHQLISVYVYV